MLFIVGNIRDLRVGVEHTLMCLLWKQKYRNRVRISDYLDALLSVETKISK